MYRTTTFESEQWLQWIEDEEGFARMPLQKEQVVTYYERATNDYQCKHLNVMHNNMRDCFYYS